MDVPIDLSQGWPGTTTLTGGPRVARGVMAPMVTYEMYVRERRSADLVAASKRPGEGSREAFRYPRWCRWATPVDVNPATRFNAPPNDPKCREQAGRRPHGGVMSGQVTAGPRSAISTRLWIVPVSS